MANFVVVKDFDKVGTLSADVAESTIKNLFGKCMAAAPYWLEVVSLFGANEERAFGTYGEYLPTKRVTAEELLLACCEGRYSFGFWINKEKKEPERVGWKGLN